jgi:drug/metabolite transporter (DMT)-like permease
MPIPRSGWLGALIVLVAAALFGSLGVLSRFAYAEGMEPFAFVAWRAGVGAVGLWVVMTAVRRPSGIRAQLRGVGPGAGRWLVLAVVLGAGLNLAAFLSFANTSVALALLGFYTYPAMVAAGSVLLGRERLEPAHVVALALATVGMAAVVLGGPPSDESGRAHLLGIGLALTAAAFQTAFVLTSRGYASVPADQAMGTILAGSAVVAIVVTVLAVGPGALALPLSSPSLLALLVYVGLFAAALPSVLFLTGIRAIGGVRTGILMLFEPVVGVALAAALLAEGLEPVQVVGGVTILLAALIVQRATHARPTESGAIAPAPGGP